MAERETQEAASAAERGEPAADVRRWLLEEEHGTLCTLAAKAELEGWPFGSIVPFALTAEGCPVLLIARIAAHTANLRRDARASLFVHERRAPSAAGGGDPQAGWRITLMGRMERLLARSGCKEGEEPPGLVDDEMLEEIGARYRARVPDAESYLQTHDFEYWRMTRVEKVRYIGGFGRITWLPGDVVRREPLGGGIADVAAGAVQHMNEDHAENLLEMCRLYGPAPEQARMSSLQRDGFFVRTKGPERLLFFPFGREIEAGDVRGAVIDVLRRARASA